MCFLIPRESRSYLIPLRLVHKYHGVCGEGRRVQLILCLGALPVQVQPTDPGGPQLLEVVRC